MLEGFARGTGLKVERGDGSAVGSKEAHRCQADPRPVAGDDDPQTPEPRVTAVIQGRSFGPPIAGENPGSGPGRARHDPFRGRTGGQGTGSIGRWPAIDDDLRACDVRSLVGQQEGHDGGHLRRLPDTAKGARVAPHGAGPPLSAKPVAASSRSSVSRSRQAGRRCTGPRRPRSRPRCFAWPVVVPLWLSRRRNIQGSCPSLNRGNIDDGAPDAGGHPPDGLDGLAHNVHGATPNPAQDLSNYMFRQYRLS